MVMQHNAKETNLDLAVAKYHLLDKCKCYYFVGSRDILTPLQL